MAEVYGKSTFEIYKSLMFQYQNLSKGRFPTPLPLKSPLPNLFNALIFPIKVNLCAYFISLNVVINDTNGYSMHFLSHSILNFELSIYWLILIYIDIHFDFIYKYYLRLLVFYEDP